MITMEGREDDALGTAEDLTQAGISTEMFIQPSDWPVGGEGNNRNSVRALTWAAENASGPGVLFVEDDIRIKPDRMLRAMAASAELNELVYLYMHDIRPRTDWYPDDLFMKEFKRNLPLPVGRFESWASGVVFPEGLKRMAKDVRMFGAQCVYIPRPYLNFIAAYMDHSEHYSAKVRSRPSQAIDTSLNNWAAGNRLPRYCYLPHPVQHLQNRKRRTAGRRDVYSKSFDMVSDLEVDSGV
ncbi:MAG: hypothetical protein LC687_06930 [Actinobacteria bacterium]|nr:hypothetical protein [Actinomycetota bacterium]